MQKRKEKKIRVKINIPTYVIKNTYISGNNIYQLGFEGLNGDTELEECEDI